MKNERKKKKGKDLENLEGNEEVVKKEKTKVDLDCCPAKLSLFV